MTYNFNEPVGRQGTSCVKYDSRKDVFGTDSVIPMWVADMDFKCPPFIIEALRKRLDHEILGYSVRRDDYYQSIIKWIEKRHAWKVEKRWISFSPGIVPALNIFTLAYTRPGDSIIIQPPVYFPFFNAVTDHGRKLLCNKLIEVDGSWGMDYKDLEKKASEGAKMIFLCNPHNPVGRAWRKDELMKLAEICLKYDMVIVSDEIHSDLVLPGYRHISLAGLDEEISGNTVTCVAPSKTFNIAGLSTSSVIISDEGLKGKFDRTIGSLHITGGNIFGTEASIAAYTQGNDWLDELITYINSNIDYLMTRLEQNKFIKARRPEATYMVWLDCRAMNMSPEDMNRFFIEKAGVGLSEGSVFGPGGEGFMRMNLACPRETLREALDKIDNALIKL